MTGFSEAWLDLRAPADKAARSALALDACRARFEGAADLSICDLGAGVGATALAVGGFLPERRRWRLVDLDASNLDEAARRLRAKGETVETAIADLAATPAPWPSGCGLVTASALFDLASATWIEAFVAALARDGAALLAMLTYDGRQNLLPEHADDARMLAAFNRHQRLDKGLGGPAAGPDAGAALEAALKRNGYAVVRGESPWRLSGDGDGALIKETLEGWAEATIEAGLVDPDMANAWLDARLRATAAMTVGHVDLFATPL